KKRDGEKLTSKELGFMVQGFVEGEITDYQMSAFLMACYIRGLDVDETSNLTKTMVFSGKQVDLSTIAGIKVDKHSTGGVGDKTTLIVAPLVAAAGVPVAKMSGRGLGHTGGTIDKLESIPGFNPYLEENEFIRQVSEIGIAVVGATENVNPADKKIYALRDVTATVSSIPLIASSIMSKKIAGGADAIVLDVKVGSGAFMKNFDEANELAKLMVNIGQIAGRKTIALITNMDEPLGHAVGNALEVKEAINTLKGQGPKDLTELCLALGSQMLVLGEIEKDVKSAKEKLKNVLFSGKSLDKFAQFIEAQGGDSGVIDNYDILPKAKIVSDYLAPTGGYISSINAEAVGKAAFELGAGRVTKDDKIDSSVGIILKHKVGDHVEASDVLIEIHANDLKLLDRADTIIDNAIEIKDKKPARKELVLEEVRGKD
ncbi:pyrimidine-nucleoside phosphorylase, partial [Candidatus Oleimmundimicrobium sp.]|uniref:pyrimidine-nucleoside phosphorylase n=1 Tax=Candidatus Oleimmundimicrobium sp. TaxID=3060597 RepID=UPI0027240D60